MNFYEYLTDYPKEADAIIRAAVMKSRVPEAHRQDAEQEIRIAWLSREVDDTFDHLQIFKYASTLAQHVALHARRSFASAITFSKDHLRDCRKEGGYATFLSLDESMNDLPCSDEDKPDNFLADNKVFAPDTLPEHNLSVLEQICEGESIRNIAEIQGRTLRRIRQQLKEIEEAFSAQKGVEAVSNED